MKFMMMILKVSKYLFFPIMLNPTRYMWNDLKTKSHASATADIIFLFAVARLLILQAYTNNQVQVIRMVHTSTTMAVQTISW